MFAPDGQHVLTIGGNDAQLWNLESRKPVVRYSPHGAVASAAVSPDGKLIATGSWDHSAKIWDAATGHAIRKLEGGHTGYINSVEFSPDGRELLTASDDGTALIWNVATGKPTGIAFHGHTGRLLSATYSPDGKQVLTVSGDKTAQIWDRATGKSLMTLKGHDWAVLCGQFSGRRPADHHRQPGRHGQDLGCPHRQRAASSSRATRRRSPRSRSRPMALGCSPAARTTRPSCGTRATGKEILSLPGHTQEVTSVSFSPDGRNVLTSSRDGTAIIWLARDWRKNDAKVAGK